MHGFKVKPINLFCLPYAGLTVTHRLIRIIIIRSIKRYLFGSNSITYSDTNDKIKQISRARLPENPEVNHAGHPNI